MTSLGEAIRTIAHKVRTASCGSTACINSFGDEQLNVDMVADGLLFEALKYSVRRGGCHARHRLHAVQPCSHAPWQRLAATQQAMRMLAAGAHAPPSPGPLAHTPLLPLLSLSLPQHCCSWACSEEVPEPVNMGGSGYSVAFDPLDGSSIVDTNFAVGTIFGVWPGDKLVGITGRDQAAAGMGIYGPRTVFVVAMKGFPGTHEFLLQDDGKWQLVKETTEIAEGKLYAPGNLRAIFDNPEYKKLVDFYLKEQYTLRYTGGMVPDVFQILVKEKGVFTNVTSPTTKAKLRILFEVAPLALLVENAGGASSCDGKGLSGLDVEITAHDQRTQICYGSVGEVARFEKYMLGSSPRFAELAAKITVPN
jgi:sedoheptulose-bisphosphatase